MHDDDRLDPVLVDGFRALDDVVPPDTWPHRAAAPTKGVRRWAVVAAAVAVLLVVGGIAVLVTGGGDAEVVVGGPVTPPLGVSAPPEPGPAADVVAGALATAEPAIVRPGEQVVVTPDGIVQRHCDKVNVIGPEVGTILAGSWFAGEEHVPATFSCDGPLTDEPVAVTVPTVETGDYRFCIAAFDVPEGCAHVTVAGLAEPVDQAIGATAPDSTGPPDTEMLAFGYHLEVDGVRVTDLRLSGPTIAGIFAGTIERWNDPAISADNPALRLPDLAILPVVRADPSGSSLQFSSWLDDQHPDAWSTLCARAGRSAGCRPSESFPTAPGMVGQAGAPGVLAVLDMPWPPGEVGGRDVDAGWGAYGPIGYVPYRYLVCNGVPVVEVLETYDGFVVYDPNRGFDAGRVRWRSHEDAAALIGHPELCSAP